MLKEKALVSNAKIEPKDNEDINPCFSKFTVKNLGMLTTLCNLCQAQTENIPQETGKSYLMLLCPICFNHFNQTLIQTERETIFSFITEVSCSLYLKYKSLLGKMVEISLRFIMRYDYTASSEQNHNLF